MTKILELDYEVQYKEGIENRVADSLSRKVKGEAHMSSMTILESTWIKEVTVSYEHNKAVLQLVTTLVTTPTNLGKYTPH